MNAPVAPPKPPAVGGELVQLPEIFYPYQPQRVWVCWRWVWNANKGKWDKPPTDTSGRRMDATDRGRWCTYGEVLAAYKTRSVDGIGISLKGLTGSEIVLDLDDCRERETGELAYWAKEIVNDAASYTEITPSGEGLRIIGRGDVGAQHKRFGDVDGAGGGVEVYTAGEGRYITITGAQLPGCMPLLNNITGITQRLLEGKGKLHPPQERVFEPAPAYEPRQIAPAVKQSDHPKLLSLIVQGVPEPGRSEQFLHAVGLAKRLGWTPEGLEDAMREYPDGIGAKYLEKGDRLEKEISRAWGKVDGRAAEPYQEIIATPYRWPDPKSIPRRQWLYGHHLIRGFVSVTVAPGGVGKSSLTIADAFAMTAGRNLLGSAPSGKLNVWLFNLEDPLEEIERRIAATAMHYGIEREDCGGLFVNSGRDTSLVIARQMREGVEILEPAVENLVREIKVRKIDVLVIDPFVSSHQVEESDNGAMDRVVKLWAKIAHMTGCAIDLVHHSRKTGGMEVTVEHARGAVALIAAARSARVLNAMTEAEGAKAGIEDKLRPLHFNVNNGKANLAPPDGKFWFKLASVDLGNGGTLSSDSVGVVTPWRWPDPLEGIVPADILKAQKAVNEAPIKCRADVQATAWGGHVIGRALGIDTTGKSGRAQVSGILKAWMQSGMFRVVEGFDEKSNVRKYLEVGTWANT